MTQAKQAEPPSRLRSPPFMVGPDHHGNWVVQEQNGMRGGLFVDRDAALRFVRSENGRRSQAFIMVSGFFELDMMHETAAAAHPQIARDLQRRAA
jgi:hypothetical protein